MTTKQYINIINYKQFKTLCVSKFYNTTHHTHDQQLKELDILEHIKAGNVKLVGMRVINVQQLINTHNQPVGRLIINEGNIWMASSYASE